MKASFFMALIIMGNLMLAIKGFSQGNKDSVTRHPAIQQNISPNDLGRYLNEASWDSLFPHRYGYRSKDSINKQRDFYDLHTLIVAAGKFPGFLTEGDEKTRKRELAAFLASIAYETGGGWSGAPDGYCRWGLYFKDERSVNIEERQYIDSSKVNYPAYPGVSYYGRGPMQISWNYNYGQFSEAWFGNKDSLLRHPVLLSTDALVSFASAIWFWMTPQFPKPSCHDIMVGNWKPNEMDSTKGRLPGFGAVVNVINGGVECGDMTENRSTTTRYRYFEFFCDYFQVSPGDHMQCGSQRPFGQ